MSSKANAYLTLPLHPTATTVYNISEFTRSILKTTDQYRVLVEQGEYNVKLTNKQLTYFTITCTGAQSPADPITIWLEFMEPVSPPA